jgi:hypothetical protein
LTAFCSPSGNTKSPASKSSSSGSAIARCIASGPPSPLGDIQPDHWLPEYTTELLNVLNVLALLVELEPKQADLLERICAGPLISEAELKSAGALEKPQAPKKSKKEKQKPMHLFDADLLIR